MKNLENYIPVNERILKFYEEFPTGRISTELIQWLDGIVIVKAYAYRDINDTNPFCTGYAYEKIDSSFITKTSALEVCETSAVGRCLAIGGYEIQKSIASREEMENATHQQELIKNNEDIIQRDKSSYYNSRDLYTELKGNSEGFEIWFNKMATSKSNKEIFEILIKRKEENK